MKNFFLILLLIVSSGCVTSSDHTKKADFNQAQLARNFEEYILIDADTPEKKALLNQVNRTRKNAENIASEDNSIFKKGDQFFDGLNALGFGGGAVGLAGMAWSILRGRKFKGLIEELVSEPDEKECLRKVNKFKHA